MPNAALECNSSRVTQNRQLAFIGDNGLDFARNGVRTVATSFYSAFKRETLPTGVLRTPQPSPGRLQIGLSNAN
jgi:hypothetical protein